MVISPHEIMNKTAIILSATMLLGSCGTSPAADCSSEYSLSELHVVESIHRGQTAPLYWSIYEYAYSMEQQGVSSDAMDYTEAQWDETIDWVAANLKPYGYDMTWYAPMDSSRCLPRMPPAI